MPAPLLVRPPSEEERQALTAGLRSADVFTVRRCQILLASARALGCCAQTVRGAIHAFTEDGVAARRRASSRPHSAAPTFDEAATARLLALLRRPCRPSGLALKGRLQLH